MPEENARTPVGPVLPLKGGRGGPDHSREVLGTTPGPQQDQDHAQGIAALIAEKAQQRTNTYNRRTQTRRIQHEQFHNARQHGLRARHAAKLKERT